MQFWLHVMSLKTEWTDRNSTLFCHNQKWSYHDIGNGFDEQQRRRRQPVWPLVHDSQNWYQITDESYSAKETKKKFKWESISSNRNHNHSARDVQCAVKMNSRAIAIGMVSNEWGVFSIYGQLSWIHLMFIGLPRYINHNRTRSTAHDTAHSLLHTHTRTYTLAFPQAANCRCREVFQSSVNDRPLIRIRHQQRHSTSSES